MTLQHRIMPFVPQGIDVKLLHPNLKLYSDQQIQLIKQQFKLNGRYRHYINERGETERLPYALYVFDGKYFASYPSKKQQVAVTNNGKIKFVQDLDSGKWAVDKIIKLIDAPGYEELCESDVVNEQAMVAAVNLAVRVGKEPVHFFRPSVQTAVEKPEKEDKKSIFGARSGMFRRKAPVKKSSSVAGKHDIFMRYAEGKNLAQWIYQKPELPLIIKMEIALDLIKAVKALHEQQILHRDLKVQNVVTDVFKKYQPQTELVDFGFAAHINQLERDAYTELGTEGYKAPEITEQDPRIPRKYSVQSDIYALGVTLSYLFRLYPTNVFFQGNEKLHQELASIFEVMCHTDPAKRGSLAEVHDTFECMKDQLNVSSRTVNVCVLNILDFMVLESADEAGLNAMYKRLQAFHQVRLFDESSAASYHTLLTIKQKLEANDIVVSAKVYQGIVCEMQSYIEDHSAHLSRTGRVYQFSYDGVQPKAVVNLSESTVSDGDVIVDIASLPLEFNSSDAEEDFLSNDAEEYDVGGCVAAFLSDVWNDGIRAAESFSSNCQPSTPLFGCSLFNSCDGSSGSVELENSIGFEARMHSEDLYRMV